MNEARGLALDVEAIGPAALAVGSFICIGADFQGHRQKVNALFARSAPK
jgi:hypothetical protein